MDLRAIRTPPTDDERACVDAALGEGWRDPAGLRAARAERHRLLPCLHAIQKRFGYIAPGALGYLCERLHVPPAEAYGVASFYALFALAPRAPTVAHVCDDIVCKAAGADGLCEEAPAALLTVAGERPFERAFGHATAVAVTDALITRR